MNVVLVINSDVSIELDTRGNIVKTVTYYAESRKPGGMVAHLDVMRGIVEKVERAVAQKHEGSIKPWQSSS